MQLVNLIVKISNILILFSKKLKINIKILYNKISFIQKIFLKVRKDTKGNSFYPYIFSYEKLEKTLFK